MCVPCNSRSGQISLLRSFGSGGVAGGRLNRRVGEQKKTLLALVFSFIVIKKTQQTNKKTKGVELHRGFAVTKSEREAPTV